MIKEIDNIISKLNIPQEYIEHYGKYKAKISNEYHNIIKEKKSGKLILVTAINPTPQGEGKTTQSIGISMALNKLGKDSIVVLREPSLGPVFGTKGGAVGGGLSKIIPSQDIDLHFTGDFHAITSANNLLCAVIDNHIFQGNDLNIDSNKICIKRVIDMNDRTLRNLTAPNGLELGFEITASCELMAICCLCSDLLDLKARIENMLVAYTCDNSPIYARDLNVVNAMVELLKDAIKSNLVQTTENTPCIVHLGPFANIAHGCNSVIATRLGLKLSDYCVTEAGFGADLGAEKFFDIKCRSANLKPDIVVLVATIKALKYNGYNGSDNNLEQENIDILRKGIINLKRHIENLRKFNIPIIVCLNRFESDTDEEIKLVETVCQDMNVEFDISTSYTDGSNGALTISKKIINILNKNDSNFKFLYDTNIGIKDKINIICKEIYRAENINYSEIAEKEIENLTDLQYNNLPICIAKTPLSFSDDPKLLGAPDNFSVTVKNVKVNSGAGFIVAYLGDILTMPGLGKHSKYEEF